MKKHKHNLAIACMALAMGLPVLAQQASPQQTTPMTQQETPKMSQAELQERGRKLREFFEPYIERAKGKEDWKFSIHEKGDEFFPVGMSFEDARVILEAAGLTPGVMPQKSSIRYWLVGISSFPNRFIYKTILAVHLEPSELRLENVTVKSSMLIFGVN
jgi:hypothetical protein